MSQFWIECLSDPRISRPLGALSPDLKHYPFMDTVSAAIVLFLIAVWMIFPERSSSMVANQPQDEPFAEYLAR